MKHKGSKPISDPAKAYSRGRVTVKTPFTLEEIVTKGESYCVNKIEAQAGVASSSYYLGDICNSIDHLVDPHTVILKTTATLLKR